MSFSTESPDPLFADFPPAVLDGTAVGISGFCAHANPISPTTQTKTKHPRIIPPSSLHDAGSRSNRVHRVIGSSRNLNPSGFEFRSPDDPMARSPDAPGSRH